MSDAATRAPAARGFADPVHDAQAGFRAILNAMARPGTVETIRAGGTAPAPLCPAAAAVCQTLLDADTPSWLDPAADTAPVRDFLRFHCGCPLVAEPAAAAFALIVDAAAMPPLARFAQGEPDYPDRAATLILQVEVLVAGVGGRLTGPGIETEARLAAAPLPEDFAGWWQANRAAYPLGVDILLTAGDRVAAMPRSVKLEA